MPHPLLLPAVAILAGVPGGLLLPGVPQPVWALLLVGAWAGAAAAFSSRHAYLFLAAVALGFWTTGALAAADRAGRARTPAIRRAVGSLLTSERQGRVVMVEGRLQQDGAPTTYGASLQVRAERVVVDGRAITADGGVRVAVGGALVRQRLGEWRAGRLVRMPVLLRRPLRYLNPGAPDQERWLLLRGTALFGSVKSAVLVEVVDSASWPAEMAAEARAAVRRIVSRTVEPFGARSAGIVTAILIGDRAGLDEDTERRLQAAGTYHVIAISGGNIAILAGLLLFIVRLAGVSWRPAAALVIAGLLAYAYVVGGGASVTRATLVAVAYLVARLGDHRAPPLNSVALAALIIVGVTPLAVLDAGFLLTFGATVAIIIGVPRILSVLRARVEERWPRAGVWWLPPCGLLAATLCAEAALVPVSARVFSLVSVAGVLLNFVAIPLMTLIQVGGLAACAVAWLHDAPARGAGYLAHLAATGLVESTRLIEYVPWLVARVPPPSLAVVLAYYAGWAGWLGSPRWPLVRRAALAVTCAALAVMLAAPPHWLPDRPRDRLRVTVLDVGQGDAALVQFPGGRSLLVDAGGAAGAFDVGTRVIAPALWALGVRRLDYLAVTHGDPDHIGGAPAVLRDFRPREVWEGVPVPPHAPRRALVQQAHARGADWRVLQAGDRLIVGGVTVHVWHPPPPTWERQRVRNDDSLVIELRLGDVSVLLPGDVGHEVERSLAPAFDRDVRRVVKVPHHGSGGSSSREFIEATTPLVAIVSAGRGNRYAHPASAVMRRYRGAGAALFSTEEDGAVLVETDGRVITIETMTGRSWREAGGPPTP